MTVPHPGTPQPGLLLNGRYLLTAHLADGGMGSVWRGTDEVLSRDVAVKVLRPEYVGDAVFAARFRAEARATAPLTSPGIAQVYDYGEHVADGSRLTYLVLELVPGEALSAVLAREGSLAPDRVLAIVAQAAAALDAAHRAGVVHRDVKPGNLLLTPTGIVKVTDFGIARARDAAPLTRTGTLIGTAHYLAPELLAGAPATPASDIYGLGVVAYQCLAGRPPFTADTAMGIALAHTRGAPPPLPESVPKPVAELVLACLEKDPQARIPSGAELAIRARALQQPGAGGAAAMATVPLALADVGPQAHDAVQPTVVAGASGGGPRVLATAAAPGAMESPSEAPGASPGPAVAPGRAGRRRPRALLPVLAALAALAAVLVSVRACDLVPSSPAPGAGGAPTTAPTTPSRAPSTPPATSPSPSPSPSASPVQVREGRLVGRPADEVAAELEGLGLVVRLVPTDERGRPGTVTDVDPKGSVPAGSTVTVSVVEDRRGSDDDGGGGG